MSALSMKDFTFRLVVLAIFVPLLAVLLYAKPSFGDTTADAKIAALEARIERTEEANLNAISEFSKLVLDMSKQLAEIEGQFDEIFANYATLADIAFREPQKLRAVIEANCKLIKRNSKLVLGLDNYRYERQRHLITVDALC